MTGEVLALGIGAFVVDETGSRTSEVQAGVRVPAASTLKPLLAWVAATSSAFVEHGHRQASWEALARQSITMSDNRAAAELWSLAGGQQLLAALNGRTGLALRIDEAGPEHPSLRVTVTAWELAAAYARLSSDPTVHAVQVRQWMRKVPTAQTFGVRFVACEALAVVLAETAGGTVGATVTTSISPDTASRIAVHQAVGNDARLAAVHDELAGEHIRRAVRHALAAAVAL